MKILCSGIKDYSPENPLYVVAIGAIMFISFTDFSGDSNINTDIAVENKIEKPKKKTNTVSTDEVENVVLEDSEEEAVENEYVEDENVEEIPEEPVDEYVEEEPSQEEMDAQSVLSDAANNPLNALAKLGGNTVIVRGDRIVLQQDNPNANIYFQFDENDIMLGLYLEYQAEDPQTASMCAGIFAQLLETDDVNIDGNMVLVKYPLSGDLKLSKDEAIRNLASSFNVMYE